MKLTSIYVKRAPKTKKYPNGLFYLGKTESENPLLYKGGGTRWNNYIKKYNFKIEDIETWVLHKTSDKEDLRNMGIYYSNLFNVVENNNWANLKPETGDGGQGKGFMKDNPNHPCKRSEVKEKIRKTLLGESNWIRGKTGIDAPMYGYKHSDETKKKISESSKKPKIKISCPHCNKLVAKGNRYHFDNCKLKSWNSKWSFRKK